MEDHLPSLHEIMAEAALEDAHQPGTVPTTFRVNPVVKERFAGICAQHGTKPSTYLRKVVERVVLDYYPAPTETEAM